MFCFKRKINVILAGDTQEKIQLRQNEEYRFSISKQIHRHRCNFSSLTHSYQKFALYLCIIKLFSLCIATCS